MHRFFPQSNDGRVPDVTQESNIKDLLHASFELQKRSRFAARDVDYPDTALELVKMLCDGYATKGACLTDSRQADQRVGTTEA